MTARLILPTEERALIYLRAQPDFCRVSVQSLFPVVRWAQLCLPTGQIAWFLWSEQSKPLGRLRMARNVKVINVQLRWSQTHSTSRSCKVQMMWLAEVCFYFIITVKSQNIALACVLCYSWPHKGLLQASRATLWSCTCHGPTKVINIKSILAVIAMVPHQPFPRDKRLFLVEKPGLDMTTIEGKDEEMGDMDIYEWCTLYIKIFCPHDFIQVATFHSTLSPTTMGSGIFYRSLCDLCDTDRSIDQVGESSNTRPQTLWVLEVNWAQASSWVPTTKCIPNPHQEKVSSLQGCPEIVSWETPEIQRSKDTQRSFKVWFQLGKFLCVFQRSFKGPQRLLKLP